MVYELLSTGAENARRSKELCSILDITPRELTAHIERERRAGQPICATTDKKRPGYYLAASQEEMQAYCQRLWHRAGEIFKTRRACLETLNSLPTEQAGISTRAIYDRMENRDFRSLYMKAKDDIIRGAVFSVNRKLSQAIDVIAEIMEDKDNNPAIRLQAAQVIIKNAGQFAERLAKDEYNSRQEARGSFDFDF